jgi:DNA excision repair protein ERCC-4
MLKTNAADKRDDGKDDYILNEFNDEIDKEEFFEKLMLKNNIIKSKQVKKNVDKDQITITQLINKKSSNNDENEDQDEDQEATVKVPSVFKKINLYMSALEGGSKQKFAILNLLYNIKPKYIILYDNELKFVRELEIYKITNPLLDLRIYFLIYTNSCEEQRYLTSIRCEKEAFELLIKQKAVGSKIC